MSLSSAAGEVTFRRAEPVMGTVVSFDIRPRGLPARETTAAVLQACAVLHDADACFSLYREDSPLSRLRRGELRPEEVPAEIGEVLDACRNVRELSGGWFDPWAAEGGVDPTGLVKGWAAERALGVLREAGAGAAMVNAAGDIALFGGPASGQRWRIGVRSPDAPDALCCVLEPEGAVATSGQYERGPHVWDPRTGAPARAARSATVCGPSLTIADGLATGLLAAGEAGFSPIVAAGYEAMIIGADGGLAHTSGFPILG
ncbi:MAG TPA: FAD:protein FMN transferase [Solirubrobacteraceae bacterium]|nr:FAD:protein FMN transferase [Solirubrobacteraceae bacterium]